VVIDAGPGWRIRQLHDRLGIERIGGHPRPPGGPPSRQWGPNWRP
jgi:hypothetical protein